MSTDTNSVLYQESTIQEKYINEQADTNDNHMKKYKHGKIQGRYTNEHTDINGVLIERWKECVLILKKRF